MSDRSNRIGQPFKMRFDWPAYRIDGETLVRVTDGKRSRATVRRVYQLRAEGRIIGDFDAWYRWRKEQDRRLKQAA